MHGNWWTKLEQMDEDQKNFVRLDENGKYLLVGPPGCGKTNLIVLRARYIYGCGLQNILVLTYTRVLQDFIRNGVGEKDLEPDQIQRFKRWALMHVASYAPETMHLYDKNAEFEVQRRQIIKMLKIANQRLNGKNLYDAILVDEVQDLHIEEVKLLMQLSDRITVAGDSKQMIYEGSGQTISSLEELGFIKKELRYHYRIGVSISDVADKALQPEKDTERLRTNCNYKEDEMQSRTELIEFEDRQAQFDAMCKTIERQLRSYPGEDIGILVPRTFMVSELQDMFARTPLASSVAYHNDDSEDHSFQSGKLIHVLVFKSAKGTEFRAVHLYGLEELKFPQNRRELLFTAITRAKTALTGYHTGKILKSVSSAFAKVQTPPSLADLF